MKSNNISKNYMKTQYVLLTLTAFSIVAFNNTKFSSISLILLLMFMLINYSINKNYILMIKWNNFFSLVLAFAVFCMTSSIWAVKNSLIAITTGITILENLIFIYVVFLCFREEKDIGGLIKSAAWSGTLVALYTIYYYGYDNLVLVMKAAGRVDSVFANLNTIGMWLGTTIILFVYLFLLEKKKIIYIIGVIPPIIVLAISESRTALIGTVIGILFCIYFHSTKQGSIFKKTSKLILALSLTLVTIAFVYNSGLFSGMALRMDKMIRALSGRKVIGEGSTTVRRIYIEAGLEQFRKTPIIGIGIRNTDVLTKEAFGYSTYLHNNYVELLASSGIIGASIYYSMYIMIIEKLIKKSMMQIEFTDISLTLLIVKLVYDYGTVSFYVKENYLVFIICYLQIYINKNMQCNELMK